MFRRPSTTSGNAARNDRHPAAAKKHPDRIRPVRMFFSVRMYFQALAWELIPHGGGLCPHTSDRAVSAPRMRAVSSDTAAPGTGTDTEVLTQISEGETYELRGEQSDGWYPVKVGEINGWVYGAYVTTETSYSYGETKEQEEARIAAEEEQKVQEAAAASLVSKGQSVVDYAYQFLGNPYVWGGTSLTNGADCSGFVQSVYAHFGISLPRTSYEQRTAGYEISYTEAQPGDLILYEGHVGIYMGDGKIINAMNEAQGIGICSATYTNIVAVRRVL